MFIIFDMVNDDLITNKNNIISYDEKRINFGKNIFYNLKGFINASSKNYSISFIYDYHSGINKFNLIVGNNYFHDCCNNEGSLFKLILILKFIKKAYSLFFIVY
jgi:hypothetical protein